MPCLKMCIRDSRVIEPKGVLPQPANKIDNNMDEIYDNEILIDVQTLNIDSASFTQIEQQAGGDKAKIAEIMMDIVAKQGKHRNPVTGSGGMLLGTVEKIGDALKMCIRDSLCTLWFMCIELYVLPHDERGEIHPGTKSRPRQFHLPTLQDLAGSHIPVAIPRPGVKPRDMRRDG